jgi:cytochrome c-type biogenesis protein CcmH/NrfG
MLAIASLQLPASAQGSRGHGASSPRYQHHGALLHHPPAVLGGGYWMWPPYYVVGTPGGPFVFMPPVVGNVPFPVPVVIQRGLIAPPPPPGLVPERAPIAADRVPARRDPARAAQLLTVGDRLFRANNIKKAEERYTQAARLDPQSAAPLVRLAQVALVRERYSEACQRLREAETAQPGWILTAPDVQALYGEPTDFARHIARLESHLQVQPGDRDAWLVLGAEWFLSGRTARAGDVFLRLDDPKRKPDVALAAFLQASRQGE